MKVSPCHFAHTVCYLPNGIRNIEYRTGGKRIRSSYIFYFIKRKVSIILVSILLSLIQYLYMNPLNLFMNSSCLSYSGTEKKPPAQNHMEKVVEKPPSQTSTHQPLSRRQSHNVNVEDIIAQQVREKKKSNGIFIGFSIISN